MLKPFYFILIIILFAVACKEVVVEAPKPNLPYNPYATIDYGLDSVVEASIDSASFLGLHKHIFSKKCGQIGCHDGSFEPNFKSIASAYQTLVYHGTIKNSADNEYKYRVMPGDTSYSWLWNRITTDDPVLGRMPLYDSLPKWQVDNIGKWILGGAKDIFDQSPLVPDFKPSLFGIYAELPDYGFIRVDTMRENFYNEPFKVGAGLNLKIWIGAYDTDVDGNDVPGYNLEYNKIKFSTSPATFDAAPELTLTKNALPSWLPSFYGDNYPYFHHITISTSSYPIGQPVYMRVYLKDAGHTAPSELPSQSSPFYLMSAFSFVVQ